MTQKNSYRSSNSNNNFDLDNYIEEKANSDQSENYPPEKELRSSNWFRNTLVVLGFGVITLLYFNNWSPIQVFGNIFGIEKYQVSSAPPVAETIPGNNVQVIQELERLAEVDALEGLAELQELEALSELAELERLNELQELENSLTDLENSEEMNQLREFALQTAMKALEGIGNSPEFGEAIGEASQLGIQEALKELQAMRELELSEAELLAEQAREFNSSFSEYSEELTKLGLDQKLESSSLQKLYEAKISTDFLQQLNALGLLDKITTDRIIQAYQERGN